MKTQNVLLKAFTILIMILTATACSKDDAIDSIDPPRGGELEQGPGLSEDDIEIYDGEIGIIISTRAIAKKGYTPGKAEISVEANSGDFDTVMEIDPLTYIVQIKHAREDLTDEQISELTAGVNLSVRVLDASDMELANEQLANVSFVSNPNEKEIASPQLPDMRGYVDLNANIAYTMQIVKPNQQGTVGAPNSSGYTTSLYDLPGTPLVIQENLDFNNDTVKLYTTYEFTKISQGAPGEGDVYTIGVRNKDDIGRIYYLYILNDDEGNGVFIQSQYNWRINGGNDNNGASANYRFRIKKEPNGFYTIAPAKNGIPLKVRSLTYYRDFSNLQFDQRTYTGLSYKPNTAGDPAYFRILALDMQYEMTTLESKFMDPIIPRASTTFGFNSTLTNCSNGLLTTEVGTAQSTESSSATRWLESMSISTRNESSTSLKISAGLSLPFRGITGLTSVSYTTSHTFSREVSSTRSIDSVITERETIELFSKRTQEVPPKSAILISDNYQSYDNIKIPFAQKFRIRGTLAGQAATGRELATQFGFNGFDGVITSVDDNSIDVTLAGNLAIDKIIDTEVFSQDVLNACN